MPESENLELKGSPGAEQRPNRREECWWKRGPGRIAERESTPKSINQIRISGNHNSRFIRFWMIPSPIWVCGATTYIMHLKVCRRIKSPSLCEHLRTQECYMPVSPYSRAMAN